MKQVTNTETVRKELPEGWQKRSASFYFRFADRKACVFYRGNGIWRGIAEAPDGLSGYEVSRDCDPLVVIAALDLEYPMEKQHGEKLAKD